MPEAASHNATLYNGHRSQPIAFNDAVAVKVSAKNAVAAVLGGMPSIVSYLANLYDIQYAFCVIITNYVVGMENRNSARAGRGFGTASTAAMLMMEKWCWCANGHQ